MNLKRIRVSAFFIAMVAVALSACDPIEKNLEAGSPPVADAGADRAIDEQALVVLDGTGSQSAAGASLVYQWSQTAGMTVSIDAATSAVATFTSPSLSATEILSFELRVIDDTGKVSSDTVSISVIPVIGLNEMPVADAGEDNIVAPRRSVVLDGSRSFDPDGTAVNYQWRQVVGTAVTLTDAEKDIASFTAPDMFGDVVLELTVTDSEGATDVDEVTITVAPLVSVSGTIEYEFVPPAIPAGLDYAATLPLPVRGATVQLIDVLSGAVLASGVTDSDGAYVLDVDRGTDTFIRVRAEMQRSGAPGWNFRVVDNTQSNTIYALDGTPFNSGLGSAGRDLLATSGWGGASYTGTRAAAPFSILDVVYQATELIRSADPNAVFPPLDLHWSTANIATGGETIAQMNSGMIGTTRFHPAFAGGGIFILGFENNDTDEYDHHVIAHEWAHYFEYTFSRTDNIGGAHTFGDQLDLRVAFGEGLGNAMSAIVKGDTRYPDAVGPGQSLGFGFDVEENSGLNPGWYSEESVQEIIYDLFDGDADGTDNIALGFSPLYSVLTNQQRDTTAVTSIFSFISGLKADRPADAANIDVLLSGQEITAVADKFGTGETNSGNPAKLDVLPVFHSISVNGPAVNVCSIDDFESVQGGMGAFNSLGARQFLSFTITGFGGTYRIIALATVTPGGASADPEIVLHQRGEIFRSESNDQNLETLDRDLTPGEYVLEVYEFGNISADPPGRTCFDVEIDQL
jgi:hypothetical protein